jgi:hypothetical protein
LSETIPIRTTATYSASRPFPPCSFWQSGDSSVAHAPQHINEVDLSAIVTGYRAVLRTHEPFSDEAMEKPGIFARMLGPEDYEIACGQKVNALGRYIGYLRIRRKTDGKLIYPFDGCEVPGPFATPDEARRAAQAMADELVQLDIAAPET